MQTKVALGYWTKMSNESNKNKEFKRIFRKFFTRNVALALIEYWHKGEYDLLKDMLQGATHFNPLFINQNGEVAVYYDINNDDTALQPLIDFILNNPHKFRELAERYETNNSRFLELIKNLSLENMKQVFEVLTQLWGFMPVLVQVGALEETKSNKEIVNKAFELRYKSQEKDALAHEYFKKIVEKLLPDYSKFWDVLRVSEILEDKIPSLEELEKRKESFIFFEKKLITNMSEDEFEDNFNIKLDYSIRVINEEEKATYQKHQRDDTLLGTSIVFRGYVGKKTSKYFSYICNPMFVLIDNGILYHFTAEEDSKNRVVNWIKTYNSEELKKHKEEHDKILEEYKDFLKDKHPEPKTSLKKIHSYFEQLLPLILVAIEVPEYGKDQVEKETVNICMKIM